MPQAVIVGVKLVGVELVGVGVKLVGVGVKLVGVGVKLVGVGVTIDSDTVFNYCFLAFTSTSELSNPNL